MLWQAAGLAFFLFLTLVGLVFRVSVYRATGSQMSPWRHFSLWSGWIVRSLVVLLLCLEFFRPQQQLFSPWVMVAIMAALASSWIASWIARKKGPPSLSLMEGGTKAFSSKWGKWVPFQSPKVRAICEHLTSSERAKLFENAAKRGQWIGRWIALPFGVTIAAFFLYPRLATIALVAFLIYFAAWCRPRLREMRQRSLEILSETEYASAQGWSPDRLKLNSFPWSR